MSAQRRLPRSTAVALLVLVVAVLGCGAPTPSVAGPAERFVARLQDPAFDLVAGLKGTYSLSSDEVFPVWGAVAIDGQDARLVTAMEGPLGIEAREQIVREAMVTERRDAAPWSDPVPLADATDVFRTALAGIESVDVVGSEVVDGQRLQHLRASGLPIGPTAFGIEGSEPSPATLEAWVDDDGAPVRLRVETGPLTVDLDPLTLGQAAPIHAPPALASLVSSALRYSFVLPASWDVRERGTSGHLIGLDGAYVITYCTAGSMKLPSWVNDGTTVYNELWAAEPESVEPVVVRAAGGSTPAMLSTWHGTAEGRSSFILDLAIVADGVACDVQWFSAPGHEAADRARFEQLVAGFRLGG
jgi:hypothetical protein